MARIHSYLGMAFVALVLALSTLVVPAPTNAAQITPAAALSVIAHCESTGGGGFLCDAFPSGGVSPYRYTWTPGSGATITQNFGGTIFGQCTVGRVISMSVTVRDSRGATASDSTSFRCYSIAP